eukprot:scaffold748_cov251-Pinguiococcus_pyrenoidosus.AAC.33
MAEASARCRLAFGSLLRRKARWSSDEALISPAEPHQESSFLCGAYDKGYVLCFEAFYLGLVRDLRVPAELLADDRPERVALCAVASQVSHQPEQVSVDLRNRAIDGGRHPCSPTLRRRKGRERRRKSGSADSSARRALS